MEKGFYKLRRAPHSQQMAAQSGPGRGGEYRAFVGMAKWVR